MDRKGVQGLTPVTQAALLRTCRRAQCLRMNATYKITRMGVVAALAVMSLTTTTKRNPDQEETLSDGNSHRDREYRRESRLMKMVALRSVANPHHTWAEV